MSRRITAIRYFVLSIAVVVLPILAWFAWANLRLSGYRSDARLFSADGDFSKAVPLLRQAAEFRPAHLGIRYELAVALRRAGRLADAEQVLRDCDNAGYDASKIELQRCLLHAQSGLVGEAEPRLREINEFGASDEIAEQIYEALSKGYMASHFLQEAWDCLAHWIEWQPGNLSARMLRGEICERNESSESAIREYESVLEYRPQYLPAVLRLAESYLHTGNVQKAQASFEASLEIDPNSIDAIVGLAECHLRVGELEQAVTAANTALEHQLSNEQAIRVWMTQAQAILALGHREKAIEAFGEILKLSPANANAHHGLSRAHGLLGNSEASDRHRALGLKRAGENTRIAQITALLINEPHSADLRYELGAILVGQGRLIEARQWFKNALLVDPSDSRSRHQLRLLEDHYINK